MISKMTKADHLKVAEVCFRFMEMARAKMMYGNETFWETRMYESLFAWAGWKE